MNPNGAWTPAPPWVHTNGLNITKAFDAKPDSNQDPPSHIHKDISLIDIVPGKCGGAEPPAN